jgi:hypothetical protein
MFDAMLAHEGTPSCLRRLSRGLRRDARGQHEKAFAQSERARARARVVQGVTCDYRMQDVTDARRFFAHTTRCQTRGSSRRVKSYPTYDPRPGVMVGSLEGHPRGSDLAGNGLMVIIPPRAPPPTPPRPRPRTSTDRPDPTASTVPVVPVR